MSSRLEQSRQAIASDEVPLYGRRSTEFITDIEPRVSEQADEVSAALLRAVDVSTVMLGAPYPVESPSTPYTEAWQSKFRQSAVLLALAEHRLEKSGRILDLSEKDEDLYCSLMSQFCEINVLMGGLSREALLERSAHPVLRFSPDDIDEYFKLCDELGIAPNIQKATLLKNNDPVAWISDFVDRTEKLRKEYLGVDGVDDMVIARLATRVDPEETMASYLKSLHEVRERFSSVEWLSEADLRFHCANYTKDPVSSLEAYVARIEEAKARYGDTFSLYEIRGIIERKPKGESDEFMRSFSSRLDELGQRYLGMPYITPRVIRTAILKDNSPEQWLDNYVSNCQSIADQNPDVESGVIKFYASKYKDPENKVKEYKERLQRLVELNNGRVRISDVKKIALVASKNYEQKLVQFAESSDILKEEFKDSKFIRPHEISVLCISMNSTDDIRDRLRSLEAFLEDLNSRYPVEGIVNTIIYNSIFKGFRDGGKRAEEIAKTYNELKQEFHDHPYLNRLHFAYLLKLLSPTEIRAHLTSLMRNFESSVQIRNADEFSRYIKGVISSDDIDDIAND